MTALRHLAQVIRSKNAGPFEITFDVIFAERADYQRVCDSGVLTPQLIGELYQVDPQEMVSFMFFEPALAFKFTLVRPGRQGGIGERDTFGAQQHAPLLDIEIP
jgi:hypothetical protein